MARGSPFLGVGSWCFGADVFSMRRAALVLALALATITAGCAGAEGRQAQELLDEAELAFAGLETYTLGGTMTMETPLGDLASR